MKAAVRAKADKVIELIRKYQVEDCRYSLVRSKVALSDIRELVEIPGYWRGTNSPKEYEAVKAGHQVLSRNYVEDAELSGMSVDRGLATVWLGEYRFCYQVDGDIIGSGPDGEPLLRNVRVLSELLEASTAIQQDTSRRDFAEALQFISSETGMTVDALRSWAYEY